MSVTTIVATGGHLAALTQECDQVIENRFIPLKRQITYSFPQKVRENYNKKHNILNMLDCINWKLKMMCRAGRCSVLHAVDEYGNRLWMSIAMERGCGETSQNWSLIHLVCQSFTSLLENMSTIKDVMDFFFSLFSLLLLMRIHAHEHSHVVYKFL